MEAALYTKTEGELNTMANKELSQLNPTLLITPGKSISNFHSGLESWAGFTTIILLLCPK